MKSLCPTNKPESKPFHAECFSKWEPLQRKNRSHLGTLTCSTFTLLLCKWQGENQHKADARVSAPITYESWESIYSIVSRKSTPPKRAGLRHCAEFQVQLQIPCNLALKSFKPQHFIFVKSRLIEYNLFTFRGVCAIITIKKKTSKPSQHTCQEIIQRFFMERKFCQMEPLTETE